METQAIGTEGAQSPILEQVATTMLAKGLQGVEEQAAELLKALPPLPESSGSRIDLLA